MHLEGFQYRRPWQSRESRPCLQGRRAGTGAACRAAPLVTAGAMPVLNPPGLRPALPSVAGNALPALLLEWLCLLPWGCSTRELPVPALSRPLRGWAGRAGLKQHCCLPAPAPAGEVLPGLLTNGKAELRLDATQCSVWFCTLKKLISSIGQG